MQENEDGNREIQENQKNQTDVAAAPALAAQQNDQVLPPSTARESSDALRAVRDVAVQVEIEDEAEGAVKLRQAESFQEQDIDGGHSGEQDELYSKAPEPRDAADGVHTCGKPPESSVSDSDSDWQPVVAGPDGRIRSACQSQSDAVDERSNDPAKSSHESMLEESRSPDESSLDRPAMEISALIPDCASRVDSVVVPALSLHGSAGDDSQTALARPRFERKMKKAEQTRQDKEREQSTIVRRRRKVLEQPTLRPLRRDGDVEDDNQLSGIVTLTLKQEIREFFASGKILGRSAPDQFERLSVLLNHKLRELDRTYLTETFIPTRRSYLLYVIWQIHLVSLPILSSPEYSAS